MMEMMPVQGAHSSHSAASRAIAVIQPGGEMAVATRFPQSGPGEAWHAAQIAGDLIDRLGRTSDSAVHIARAERLLNDRIASMAEEGGADHASIAALRSGVVDKLTGARRRIERSAAGKRGEAVVYGALGFTGAAAALPSAYGVGRGVTRIAHEYAAGPARDDYAIGQGGWEIAGGGLFGLWGGSSFVYSAMQIRQLLTAAKSLDAQALVLRKLECALTPSPQRATAATHDSEASSS